MLLTKYCSHLLVIEHSGGFHIVMSQKIYNRYIVWINIDVHSIQYSVSPLQQNHVILAAQKVSFLLFIEWLEKRVV